MNNNTIPRNINMQNMNPDPINKLIGKIVIVEADYRFAARLIAVVGPELWFESKRGAVWMRSRNDIQNICLGTQV
jgi:hypothetical protein